MTEQALSKAPVEDPALTEATVGDPAIKKAAKAAMSAAARDKVTTKQLLVLTWVVLIALAVNIVAGMFWVSAVSDNLMWARLFYSLAVSLGLMILVCFLLYLLSRIRMEG